MLAEIGLAPLVFDVLRLRLTSDEAHGLVGRLVAIIGVVQQHRAQQLERRGTGIEEVANEMERESRRRRS